MQQMLSVLPEQITEMSEKTAWNMDQNILTYLILKSGLCSVPKEHPLWSLLGLEAKPFDDSNKCYHGNEFNCYAKRQNNQCKWWHFMTSETKIDLAKKYHEVVQNWSPI